LKEEVLRPKQNGNHRCPNGALPNQPPVLDQRSEKVAEQNLVVLVLVLRIRHGHLPLSFTIRIRTASGSALTTVEPHAR
jgi:hypothetical protein